MGQLVATDGPLGGHGADLPGNPDRIELDYNTLGQRIWVDDPDKGVWRYRYNGFGELTCQIDAEGNGTWIVYDVLGRKTDRFDRTGVDDLDSCQGIQANHTNWTWSDDQNHTLGQLTSETTTNAPNSLLGLLGTAVEYAHEYDTFGRIRATYTTITEGVRSVVYPPERIQYDEIGRVYQRFDATGGDRGERYVYSAGYLSKVFDPRADVENGTPYREVKQTDARGQILHAELGNGIVIENTYDPATGRPTIQSEQARNTAFALFYQYQWDVLGHLTQREDLAAGLHTEYYQYDAVNRLTTHWSIQDTGGPARPTLSNHNGWTLNQHLRYDAVGNIQCKSDVFSGLGDCQSEPDHYQYGQGIDPDDPGSAGPHAVLSARESNGLREFQYDSNGNMIRDWVAGGSTDRQLDYTAFNKLQRVRRNGQTSDFHYGPDRSRFLQRKREGGSIVERIHYVGGVEFVYSGHLAPNATDRYSTARRPVAGTAQELIHLSSINELRYQHVDHLGSIVAYSDGFGDVRARMSFDAWGSRRDAESAIGVWRQWGQHATPAWAQNMINITPRGYTGHEHLDQFGLIHMNGRIYDPTLGRFLQADPFMEDTGTLNRYTYVHNNPLVYTDPSGYLSWREVAAVAISIVAVATQQYWALYVNKGLGFAAVGYTAGYLSTGTGRGALAGAFSAVAFYQIGQHFPASAGDAGVLGTSYTGPELVRASIAHGVVGGVGSSIQGGRFGHGFAAAGFGKLATPVAMGVTDNVYGQAVAVAIVGGTGSEITGGKFANGAVTAAVGFALNQRASQSDSQDAANEASIEIVYEGEGLERLQNAELRFGVAGLMRGEFPAGDHTVRFRIDPELVDSTSGMKFIGNRTVAVNPEYLQRKSLNMIGSAMGHELIHVRDHMLGNLIMNNQASVDRSEFRAYGFQSRTSRHFALPVGDKIFINNQLNYYREITRQD